MARLVNKQFNSPIGLYSHQNIQDVMDRDAQILANGAVGIDFNNPGVGKPDNLKNSAVLRMLEEEENRQRNGHETGVKRVAWPPPYETGPSGYNETNPIQPQGGPHYPSQSAGHQQNNQPHQSAPSNAPYQQQRAPLKLDVSQGGPSPLASPLLNQSPQGYRPATPAKNWASVHSPVATPNPPSWGSPVQPNQPNQPAWRQKNPTKFQAAHQPVSQQTFLGQQYSGAPISHQPVQQYQSPNQQYQSPEQQYQSPGQQYQSPAQYQSPGQQYQSPGQQYQSPGQQYQSPAQYQSPGQQYQSPGQQYQSPGQQYQSPAQYQSPGQQYQSAGQLYQSPGQQYDHFDQSVADQYNNIRQQSSEQYSYSEQYQSSEQVNNQHPIQYQSSPVQGCGAPAAQVQRQPSRPVEPPPTTITLRPEPPVNQAPPPVYSSQPATATLKVIVNPKNLRGDLKWPPDDVRRKMLDEAENVANSNSFLSLQGGKHLRGDLKWPPEEVKQQAAEENRLRLELAKGPVCRPRKVKRDYTSFFEQHALNNTYPGYKIPPGTQFYKTA
ncbi:unnamed protein product [Phyllotreta striolata]|uniref:Zasp-like motif domain-containing protein n=1 Tax=Phyllotreta striolata TaxID=444603 RepID=A0A9P0E0U7_PHYSR|nr:unnamed protein product [Phyllotreta striolata]